MDVSSGPAAEAVCENCAGEDEDLVWVWPVPADAGGAPELWCADCRDRFPWEEADGPEASDEG